MANIVVEIALRPLTPEDLPKIHPSDAIYGQYSSRKLLLMVEGEYCFGYYVKYQVMGKDHFAWMIEGRAGNWKITHWGYLRYPKKNTKGKEDPLTKKFKLSGIPKEFEMSFNEDAQKRRSSKSARRNRNKKGKI